VDQRPDLVSKHWGDGELTSKLQDSYWTASPVVRRHLNRRASGDPDGDWLTGLDVAVLGPLGKALDILVLGCGEGWLERVLARSPAARSIDAVDISPEAVSRARQQAREEGLSKLCYSVLDLNREALESDRYDVVIAHSVLHHVEALEHAYRSIRAALRTGGLLVVNEYVGPNRLQYTDQQLELVNRIMGALPERLRYSAIDELLLDRRERPPVEQMIATDPSEAVRSEEVLAVAERWFETLHRVDLGGTVLQPLLYGLIQSFRPGNADDDAVLGLICLLEEQLVDGQVLASDFVLSIMRARDEVSPSLVIPEVERASPEPAGSRLKRLISRLGGGVKGVSSSRGAELGGWTSARQHLHRLVSGDPHCDPATWFLHELELRQGRQPGTGTAALLEHGWLAPVLQDSFERVDVGDRLQPGAYDAVLSTGSLGPDIADPSRINRIADALKPGGGLVALERLAAANRPAPEKHQRLAQEFLDLLPERFGHPKVVTDGSRAGRRVTIAEVKQALEPRLQVTILKPLGWGLLQLVLPAIAGRIDEDREADQTLLELLYLVDEQLTGGGVIDCELVLVIAMAP
jgi:SAM-dependent methyltransferase